jgi:hypothetical protein
MYPTPSAPPQYHHFQYTYAQPPLCYLCKTKCTQRYLFPCQQEHFVHLQCYEYQLIKYIPIDSTECILCRSSHEYEPYPFIGGVVLDPISRIQEPVSVFIPPSDHRFCRSKKICLLSFCTLAICITICLIVYFILNQR